VFSTPVNIPTINFRCISLFDRGISAGALTRIEVSRLGPRTPVWSLKTTKDQRPGRHPRGSVVRVRSGRLRDLEGNNDRKKHDEGIVKQSSTSCESELW